MDFSWLFLLFGVLTPQIACKPAGKVVTTHRGDVKGRISVSREGRLYAEYWGIPYGKATRFELSRAAPNWEGILDASKKPLPCLYADMKSGKNFGSEDCLFINVHTPQTHPRYVLKNMPVLVVIHGSFSDWQDHAGHYFGAKYFMDEDVVLVTFNYRLGVLGFMTTNDQTMHSNLGLKDQALALKWVQKNIRFFGGDPNKVTLVGDGSGAASVHYHFWSPMSKGLFHRAILQSGNALCPWALVDDPESLYTSFAKSVGCGDNMESKAVLDCMKEKDASELVNASSKANSLFHGERNYTGNNIYFGPVVEHWMRNWPELPVFIPNYPQNLLANVSNETMSVIPILIGVNELDGITLDWADHLIREFEPPTATTPFPVIDVTERATVIPSENDSDPDLEPDPAENNNEPTTIPPTTLPPTTIAPTTVDIGTGLPEMDMPQNEVVWEDFDSHNFPLYFGYKNRVNATEEVNSKIQDYYFKGEDGVKGEDGSGSAFYKALGHRNYFQCTRNAAVANAKIAPTFVYYLSYNRNVSLLDLWTDKFGSPYRMIKYNRTSFRGAVHGDDLQYLYDIDEPADFPLIRSKFREMSLRFSQNMVKFWSNFAREGKPSGDWEPLPEGQEKGGIQWQKLGDIREPVDEPFRAEVDFWDGLNLDPLRELPPLLLKNQTTRHRNGSSGDDDGMYENSNDKYKDIIYVDTDGDDDGTGGLFIFPPL